MTWAMKRAEMTQRKMGNRANMGERIMGQISDDKGGDRKEENKLPVFWGGTWGYGQKNCCSRKRNPNICNALTLYFCLQNTIHCHFTPKVSVEHFSVGKLNIAICQQKGKCSLIFLFLQSIHKSNLFHIRLTHEDRCMLQRVWALQVQTRNQTISCKFRFLLKLGTCNSADLRPSSHFLYLSISAY